VAVAGLGGGMTVLLRDWPEMAIGDITTEFLPYTGGAGWPIAGPIRPQGGFKGGSGGADTLRHDSVSTELISGTGILGQGCGQNHDVVALSETAVIINLPPTSGGAMMPVEHSNASTGHRSIFVVRQFAP
jgi:hypothetical protein